MVIQSNCFAAWNYGRDVGETVNLDVQRTFYLHFLVNCMGMYCQLLFFPPTGDLVLHFINSLERPQSFQKELLRLFKFSCRKKAAVLVQPEPECSPPFCKVPIFGRGPIATMWWSLASRHEKGLVTSRNFFHGCRWGWLGFPSHVEVSIFGILPNSLANPQTIAGSQWKIRLCRENRYQFQILGCLLYLLFECCLHIYIYFISILVRNCWSVFYHDAVKFWTFNPNTEPQQLGLDLVDPPVVERRTSQRYQRDSNVFGSGEAHGSIWGLDMSGFCISRNLGTR